MRIPGLATDLLSLRAAFPAWTAFVRGVDLRDACEAAKAQGGRLVALWGSDERTQGKGFTAHVALALPAGLLCLRTDAGREAPVVPGIADIFPAAGRMQRAMHDLLGIRSEGERDHRKWLRHGAWPADVFPLRKDSDGGAVHPPAEDAYPFVRVEGDGVHEIPVGPVHAGTIEPGHFRFSIVGEVVLRLEQRLGYKHKGIEKRAESMSAGEGHRLAGRVSGDSTVAYAWAYAQAFEGIAGIAVPARAVWLRAVLLELERLHNHLGDLGYLGNDVALAFGFHQFWRLKERVLRANAALFGHRYLMDLVVPGGVARDLALDGPQQLFELCHALESEIARLRGIYEEHAGVQDRFMGAGCVTPELAQTLGLAGFAGRASGQAFDLRVDLPVAPYDRLGVRKAGSRKGDVAARCAVRFDEVTESLRLIQALLGQGPAGDISAPLPPTCPAGFGIGWIEGWRGDVFLALTVGADARIERLHPHDPSWRNWPLLERAVIDNIVPDFPLINKSFNLSYAGQDL
jgi:Ni,Fe-hydrogenase III large subunit/Ni,Fe-hydrogenase III component G